MKRKSIFENSFHANTQYTTPMKSSGPYKLGNIQSARFGPSLVLAPVSPISELRCKNYLQIHRNYVFHSYHRITDYFRQTNQQ